MSEVTQTGTTRNQTNFKYDYSKIFLRNILTREIEISASGSDLELEAGMVIGTISASGKGKVMASGSSDGSQYPTGMVIQAVTIADGDTATVTICIGGEVDKNGIILDGTDTLSTAVSDRIYLDWLRSIGITAKETDSLSEYDNE